MRILLDEDTPVQFLAVLRHVLPKHQVDHVQELNWKSKKDKHVLPDARSRRYQVFVTNDSNQLEDPDECDAIKRSGLHHVSYRQRHKGREGLALALGAVVAAMPQIIAELEMCGGQRLVHVAGLDPKNRYTSIDPIISPPRYWR